MNCDYINTQATQLSVRYSRNPIEAAMALGAIVSFKDLGTLKGLFLSSMPKPTIVINEMLDEATQKIVCAHELGHFILHNDTNFSCEDISFESKSLVGKLEREANIFAASFLIDSDEAIKYLKEGYSTFEVAAMLRTDVNLLLFCLNMMGLCNAPDSAFLK